MIRLLALVVTVALSSAGGAKGVVPQSAAGARAHTVNRAVPAELPLEEGAAGPAVIRIQVLLDRNRDSPGVIDGRWEHNSELAVRAFQERSGLPVTGRVDRRTLDALLRRGDSPAVTAHTITHRDIEGPFARIPEDAAEQARMRCLCYESPAEKLAERFHTTPEVLRQLNPGVDLDHLSAGEEILAPAARAERAQGARVARIVVHLADGYLRALDGRGRVLFHFPVTVGARYTRSPTGSFQVTRVTHRPTWRDDVDPGGSGLELPAGPNSPVGLVWIGLSEKGYGIHGTSVPDRIGHSGSHGCIRLTNWDALLLARSVRPGVRVELVR